MFGSKNKSSNRSASRSSGSSRNFHLSKSERATLANVGVIPTESPIVKEKNFNAKLARLNSLKRNYYAFQNSNDPHLASIVSFLEATESYESRAADLKALKDDLTSAQELLSESLAAIEAHDEFSYEGLTSEELEARLSELDSTDTTDYSDEQIQALESERDALATALESDNYSTFKDAEAAYMDEKDSIAELESQTSDEALKQALLDMANENRVREYGDDYVDEEMLDWAKQTLGISDGEEEIDQAGDATDDAGETGDTEDGSLPDES